MRTALADFVRDTPAGNEAQAILRACVHCGLCLPACPTYQLLGDELDSPRGRIYLIKELLEGRTVTACTQLHLDRCLTCRACESACPSGVEYGRLLEVGRALSEARAPRSPAARAQRYLLRALLPHRRRVRALVAVARLARPLLPRALAAPLAAARAAVAVGGRRPAARHARRVLLMPGCVQPALRPGIDLAAARLLDAVGVSAVTARGTSCCGALAHHLAAPRAALRCLRRNVDALWPQLEAGAEAVVMTASACAAMLSDYGRLLRDDPGYATRAARVSAAARDISQLLAPAGAALASVLSPGAAAALGPVAVHTPCTLTNALKASGTVAGLLSAAGFALTPTPERQPCCGAAGTYSILQPQLSAQLLRARVTALESGAPRVIATANIGCLAHLASASSRPVCHWAELLAHALPRRTERG